MKNTNGPLRQNGQLRNGPVMRNGQRNGPLTATQLHFDDETAAYERKAAQNAISPRTKWYDITKQLVASSRDNSPNHHKLNSDYQWRQLNGPVANGHLVNGNKNSVVSDDSECQTAKMTNSSQCSVVVTESVAPPGGHHHTSRADALIEAKTCSFEDSVPIASYFDEAASDKLSAVDENQCSRLIPNIEHSILVDVSHLTDCSSSGYNHQRVPNSHPATPEHVFVPIETGEPCTSYVPQPAGYERDRSRTQETSFTGNPHHHNHHRHHHHHHHRPHKYKTRSRKFKMEKQLELTTRRKKRKRQQRHQLWSNGGGGAEGIEEERRRRQNHKMSHRRRASSVSVQKTRNVTKSMVCLKILKINANNKNIYKWLV